MTRSERVTSPPPLSQRSVYQEESMSKRLPSPPRAEERAPRLNSDDLDELNRAMSLASSMSSSSNSSDKVTASPMPGEEVETKESERGEEERAIKHLEQKSKRFDEGIKDLPKLTEVDEEVRTLVSSLVDLDEGSAERLKSMLKIAELYRDRLLDLDQSEALVLGSFKSRAL